MASSAWRRDAGRLFVFGPPGATGEGSLRAAFAELNVGGLILFGRHTPSAEAAAALIAEVQSLAQGRAWVMIDQEGGRVRRLKEPRFELPAARELSRLSLGDVQTRACRLGVALRELGIHVNLAPVLDVDSNPANPVIGDRAFAADAASVFRYGEAYRLGLEAAGVLACGKHFPGHGDTALDSHLALPFVTHDIERLRAVELAPFVQAVAHEWPLLMAAHVVFTALDPDEPATLSPRIGQHLLRDDMGFRGLLLSDDLEMKAVATRYESRELVRRLLEAGVDQLLVCSDFAKLTSLHRALTELLESGEIPRARLDLSLERLATARAYQAALPT